MYMTCTTHRTIQVKGPRTVSVRVGGTKGLGITVAVTVAMDRTKLPLLVAFKGKAGHDCESLERNYTCRDRMRCTGESMDGCSNDEFVLQ